MFIQPSLHFHWLKSPWQQVDIFSYSPSQKRWQLSLKIYLNKRCENYRNKTFFLKDLQEWKSAFLIPVGRWQLPMYIEKKHYHIGEKVAEVSFVWHPDALFQPNDISIGTFLLQKIPKHINFQDNRQENNAL